MDKKLLVIANWKMQLTHDESLVFLKQYLSLYEELLPSSLISLVICPSFTVLPYLATFASRSVQWGAQNCSAELKGPYTGDISALSLKELGIRFCIIGHSEQRVYHCETDQSVACKAELLINQSIIPIVCIGESEEERAKGQPLQTLEKQLRLLSVLKEKNPDAQFIIAYEPLWAIGAARTPSFEELREVVFFITDFFKEYGSTVKILYGGSVSFETRALFAELPLDGYLLGRQGAEGETLKKIILLW